MARTRPATRRLSNSNNGSGGRCRALGGFAACVIFNSEKAPAPFRDMVSAHLISVLLVGLLLVGCGFPSNDEVESAFRREHPSYTVLSVGVGEGDGSSAYYHIKYKKPEDGRVYEDVWQYLDDGSGKKVLKHKETLNEPK